MAQGRIRRLVTRILKWVWVPVVAFVLVVAVAMACAVWSPEGRVYGVNKMGYVSSNPAHSERVPTALYQRYGKLRKGSRAKGLGMSSYLLLLRLPGEDPISRTPRYFELGVVRSGFPFRCLRATIELQYKLPASSLWMRGIETSRPSTMYGRGRSIPLMPEPVGMVLNVLIYSAAIVLVRVAWRRVIVSRRKHEILCLDCAYPLGDFAVCPECGKPTGRDA